MIIESLFGLSLVLNVSFDNRRPPRRTARLHMAIPQRNAELLPLVHRATARIGDTALADLRYHTDMRPNEINDLIVDSMVTCCSAVHAMIRADDRMYGAGSGEAFLLGPYLDALGAATTHQITRKAR